MQNKDDKVGNKTANKQERQRKKREQERKIEIDSQKKVEILGFAHAWKTKKLFNYARLVKKHAFFLAKLFFSLSYANQPKTSPKKRNWWKMWFFPYSMAVTKGLIKLLIFFNWAPRNAAQAPNFFF